MKHPGGRPRKGISISADAIPAHQEWFTVSEVSEITGLHVRTIQARLRDGTLQGKRLGGTWRIYRNSLVNDKVESDLNIQKGR